MNIAEPDKLHPEKQFVTVATRTASRVEPELAILSQLLLGVAHTEQISQITWEKFEETVALGHSNHVVLRALEEFHRIMAVLGDSERAAWADQAMRQERARIENAMSFLYGVC